MTTHDTRLRAAINEIMRHQFTHSRDAMYALQELIDAADHAADEIERLRAELDTYKDSCSAKADRIDRLGETVEKLRAERDAFRSVLRDIADEWPGSECGMVAADALRERVGEKE